MRITDEELEAVEQIYMSYGDNETDEAIVLLNRYAEYYYKQRLDECNNKPPGEVSALQCPTNCPLDAVDDQGIQDDPFDRR